MPSMPLIAYSSGIATVSAITFGLAPGYGACTTIDGGTTSGYSAIGSARMAIKPASRMRTESPPAKIGRSMKNFERFMVLCLRSDPASRHRHRLGRHERAGAHALQPVHDDAFVGLQSRRHDAQPVGARAEGNLAIRGLVVGAHHHHELLVLVGAHRALADEERRRRGGASQAKLGELARHQAAVAVVEHRAHAHRAGL